jgi:hypothetical protein
MENLPFLKPNDRELRSRNDPPQSENEWPQSGGGGGDYAIPASPKPDVFEALKANPMSLILLGIVIGVLLANMRPVIIQSKP